MDVVVDLWTLPLGISSSALASLITALAVFVNCTMCTFACKTDVHVDIAGHDKYCVYGQ